MGEGEAGGKVEAGGAVGVGGALISSLVSGLMIGMAAETCLEGVTGVGG